MLNQDQISQVQSALATAQSIFIALPQDPSFDQVAAGLGLYLSFQGARKTVDIASSTEMIVEFSSLIGVNKIKTSFQGGRDSLTISFDYIEDAIEKVSYNIDNGKFNLVIKPKLGHPPLDPEKVLYSYSGNKVDLIFTIGAKSLDSLGNIFKDNREFFETNKIINLDCDSENQQHGQINLINQTAASISEEAVNLIIQLKLPANEDVGTNLLQGIEWATDRFGSAKVGPTTFESAAFCLKIGARRQIKKLSKKKTKNKFPLKPMTTKVSAEKAPVEQDEKKDEPSPDWFEPKIYKGQTRI